MTNHPAALVSVPPHALEAIAFNLCSLHDFDPAFVQQNERFAKAAITEYLRATPAPAAPQAAGVGEDVRKAIARIIFPESERVKMDREWGGNRNHSRNRWTKALEQADQIIALRAPSREPEGGVVWSAAIEAAAKTVERQIPDAAGGPMSHTNTARVFLFDAVKAIRALATREEAPAPHGVERTVTLQSAKGPVDVDVSLAPIVQALWDRGLMTVAACSGHTHRPGNIALADGRELVIARDYDEARRIDALFPLNIQGEEAPAEAGGGDVRIPRRLAETALRLLSGNGLSVQADKLEAALRAQPQAREDAQPVAWRGRDLDAFGDGAWALCTFKPSCDVVEPLYTHPAPDALRLAVEALEPFAYFAKHGTSCEYINSDAPDDGLCAAASFPAGAYRGAVKALAALQAEQKGGA